MVPYEDGIGFVDDVSANLLRTRPERVFVLFSMGERTLDGNVPRWQRNPFEVGAMHGQTRRTFTVLSIPE